MGLYNLLLFVIFGVCVWGGEQFRSCYLHIYVIYGANYTMCFGIGILDTSDA